MNEANPAIERYMTRFENSMQNYRLREWKEIAGDLRSHIAEALEYGKALDEVLQALGPADVLARAYAIELKMNQPSDTRGKAIGRFLSVIGVLAASGVVSFLVVTALGSIALGFLGSGLAMIAIGVLEAVGVHLPSVQLAGIHPLIVAALGPIIMLVGILAAWGLWAYVRATIRMLQRAVPRALTPAP